MHFSSLDTHHGSFQCHPSTLQPVPEGSKTADDVLFVKYMPAPCTSLWKTVVCGSVGVVPAEVICAILTSEETALS